MSSWPFPECPDLSWAADDHNWLPIREAARLEDMTLTEYYDYLYKLDQIGVWVIGRMDLDHQIEIYVGTRFLDLGDYYRLTSKAFAQLQAERHAQQETVVYLTNLLRQLGVATQGMPQARHFRIDPRLICKH